jgi:Zn-dependent oligopeptidase
VADLHAAFSSTPLPVATCPAAKFGHLVGYGGAYYSYLYADCIAGGVWAAAGGRDGGRGVSLADDPLSPVAGAAVRDALLAPGCAGEPRAIVGAALGGVALPAGGGWAPDYRARLAEVGIVVD